MTTFDPEQQLVVDLSSGNEIKGAVEVDMDTLHVAVVEKTYNGDVRRTLYLPAGIRIVRRR